MRTRARGDTAVGDADGADKAISQQVAPEVGESERVRVPKLREIVSGVARRVLQLNPKYRNRQTDRSRREQEASRRPNIEFHHDGSDSNATSQRVPNSKYWYLGEDIEAMLNAKIAGIGGYSEGRKYLLASDAFRDAKWTGSQETPVHVCVLRIAALHGDESVITNHPSISLALGTSFYEDITDSIVRVITSSQQILSQVKEYIDSQGEPSIELIEYIRGFLPQSLNVEAAIKSAIRRIASLDFNAEQLRESLRQEQRSVAAEIQHLLPTDEAGSPVYIKLIFPLHADSNHWLTGETQCLFFRRGNVLKVSMQFYLHDPMHTNRKISHFEMKHAGESFRSALRSCLGDDIELQIKARSSMSPYRRTRQIDSVSCGPIAVNEIFKRILGHDLNAYPYNRGAFELRTAQLQDVIQADGGTVSEPLKLQIYRRSTLAPAADFILGQLIPTSSQDSAVSSGVTIGTSADYSSIDSVGSAGLDEDYELSDEIEDVSANVPGSSSAILTESNGERPIGTWTPDNLGENLSLSPEQSFDIKQVLEVPDTVHVSEGRVSSDEYECMVLALKQYYKKVCQFDQLTEDYDPVRLIFEKRHTDVDALESTLYSSPFKKISITAEPGFGKSHLCMKIVSDWMRKHDQQEETYDFVFFLNPKKLLGSQSFRDWVVRSVFSDRQILDDTYYGKVELDHIKIHLNKILAGILRDKSLKVLFVVDGLEQLQYVLHADRAFAKGGIKSTEERILAYLLLDFPYEHQMIIATRKVVLSRFDVDFPYMFELKGYSNLQVVNRTQKLLGKALTSNFINFIYSYPSLKLLAQNPKLLNRYCQFAKVNADSFTEQVKFSRFLVETYKGILKGVAQNDPTYTQRSVLTPDGVQQMQQYYQVELSVIKEICLNYVFTQTSSHSMEMSAHYLLKRIATAKSKTSITRLDQDILKNILVSDAFMTGEFLCAASLDSADMLSRLSFILNRKVMTYFFAALAFVEKIENSNDDVVEKYFVWLDQHKFSNRCKEMIWMIYGLTEYNLSTLELSVRMDRKKTERLWNILLKGEHELTISTKRFSTLTHAIEQGYSSLLSLGADRVALACSQLQPWVSLAMRPPHAVLGLEEKQYHAQTTDIVSTLTACPNFAGMIMTYRNQGESEPRLYSDLLRLRGDRRARVFSMLFRPLYSQPWYQRFSDGFLRYYESAFGQSPENDFKLTKRNRELFKEDYHIFIFLRFVQQYETEPKHTLKLFFDENPMSKGFYSFEVLQRFLIKHEWLCENTKLLKIIMLHLIQAHADTLLEKISGFINGTFSNETLEHQFFTRFFPWLQRSEESPDSDDGQSGGDIRFQLSVQSNDSEEDASVQSSVDKQSGSTNVQSNEHNVNLAIAVFQCHLEVEAGYLLIGIHNSDSRSERTVHNQTIFNGALKWLGSLPSRAYIDLLSKFQIILPPIESLISNDDLIGCRDLLINIFREPLLDRDDSIGAYFSFLEAVLKFNEFEDWNRYLHSAFEAIYRERDVAQARAAAGIRKKQLIRRERSATNLRRLRGGTLSRQASPYDPAESALDRNETVLARASAFHAIDLAMIERLINESSWSRLKTNIPFVTELLYKLEALHFVPKSILMGLSDILLVSESIFRRNKRAIARTYPETAEERLIRKRNETRDAKEVYPILKFAQKRLIALWDFHWGHEKLERTAYLERLCAIVSRCLKIAHSLDRKRTQRKARKSSGEFDRLKEVAFDILRYLAGFTPDRCKPDALTFLQIQYLEWILRFHNDESAQPILLMLPSSFAYQTLQRPDLFQRLYTSLKESRYPTLSFLVYSIYNEGNAGHERQQNIWAKVPNEKSYLRSFVQMNMYLSQAQSGQPSSDELAQIMALPEHVHNHAPFSAFFFLITLTEELPFGELGFQLLKDIHARHKVAFRTQTDFFRHVSQLERYFVPRKISTSVVFNDTVLHSLERSDTTGKRAVNRLLVRLLACSRNFDSNSVHSVLPEIIRLEFYVPFMETFLDVNSGSPYMFHLIEAGLSSPFIDDVEVALFALEQYSIKFLWLDEVLTYCREVRANSVSASGSNEKIITYINSVIHPTIPVIAGEIMVDPIQYTFDLLSSSLNIYKNIYQRLPALLVDVRSRRHFFAQKLCFAASMRMPAPVTSHIAHLALFKEVVNFIFDTYKKEYWSEASSSSPSRVVIMPLDMEELIAQRELLVQYMQRYKFPADEFFVFTLNMLRDIQNISEVGLPPQKQNALSKAKKRIRLLLQTVLRANIAALNEVTLSVFLQSWLLQNSTYIEDKLDYPIQTMILDLAGSDIEIYMHEMLQPLLRLDDLSSVQEVYGELFSQRIELGNILSACDRAAISFDRRLIKVMAQQLSYVEALPPVVLYVLVKGFLESSKIHLQKSNLPSDGVDALLQQAEPVTDRSKTTFSFFSSLRSSEQNAKSTAMQSLVRSLHQHSHVDDSHLSKRQRKLTTGNALVTLARMQHKGVVENFGAHAFILIERITKAGRIILDKVDLVYEKDQDNPERSQVKVRNLNYKYLVSGSFPAIELSRNGRPVVVELVAYAESVNFLSDLQVLVIKESDYMELSDSPQSKRLASILEKNRYIVCLEEGGLKMDEGLAGSVINALLSNNPGKSTLAKGATKLSQVSAQKSNHTQQPDQGTVTLRQQPADQDGAPDPAPQSLGSTRKVENEPKRRLQERVRRAEYKGTTFLFTAEEADRLIAEIQYQRTRLMGYSTLSRPERRRAIHRNHNVVDRKAIYSCVSWAVDVILRVGNKEANRILSENGARASIKLLLASSQSYAALGGKLRASSDHMMHKFCRLIKRGKLFELQKIYSHNPDYSHPTIRINELCPYRDFQKIRSIKLKAYTPLMLACIYGRFEVVRWLVENCNANVAQEIERPGKAPLTALYCCRHYYKGRDRGSIIDLLERELSTLRDSAAANRR